MSINELPCTKEVISPMVLLLLKNTCPKAINDTLNKGLDGRILSGTSRKSWNLCPSVYAGCIKGEKVYRTNIQCLPWYPYGWLKPTHQCALEAACKRAFTGQCYSYTTINNILLNNLDTLKPDQPLLFNMPEHNNLRGPGAYN